MPQPSKYTKERLEQAVKESLSLAQVIKFFGLKQTGGSQSYLKRLISQNGIDTSHFLGQGMHKGSRSPQRKTSEQLLVVGEPLSLPEKSSRLRRALDDIGRDRRCACGVGEEWQGRKLRLQVDHLNGKRWDNRPENLEYKCPNCHSQTDNWGSKNKSI